jgi:predicted nucleic acid-binding Zn ribbon protein
VIDRIGDNVKRELARFVPGAGIADVVAAWPAAVGETIARHAWPARIGRDGTLHVATDSSVWAFELGQLASVVLERLRAALSDDAPSGLRFAPGRLPEGPPAAAAQPAQPRVEPRDEDHALARRLTAGIGDEQLRLLVARAAAASLARAAADR